MGEDGEGERGGVTGGGRDGGIGIGDGAEGGRGQIGDGVGG